jgi:zinc protease
MINRKTAPAPKENITFSIPEIKLLRSANGTDIYFVKKDKLPIVQLTAMFSGGSKFDPSDKTGLAYLTSMMIDEGAGKYDSLQLNNEFEKLGSVINISSDHDSFSFSLLSLKENFNRTFELLSYIINEPWFNEKDFLREKKKVLDRILQLKDEPSFIASSAFEKQIFGSQFYAFPEIGFNGTVGNISINDIKDFYKNVLLNSEIKLVAVGNIEETELINMIDKYLPANINSVIQPQFLQPVRSKTKIYFINKPDSAQSEIRVGHISKNRQAEDFYATRLMNTTLGGQFSSRINLNLREKKGFTYGAYSSFNYFQKAGFFDVSTAVDIQNTAEAVSEILKELNSIREDISGKEIDFAKSYLVKQFPSKFETYIQVARNIIPIIEHSLPLDYYQRYTNILKNVSETEIRQAAVENIHPEELIALVVGDKKIIEPQLKTIANDNLFELDLFGNILE